MDTEAAYLISFYKSSETTAVRSTLGAFYLLPISFTVLVYIKLSDTIFES